MFKLRKNYRIPRKTESKYFFLTKNKENATNRTSIGSTTIPKSVWVARATHSDYNRADNSARLYIICHQFNIRDLISNVHFSLTLSRDICVLHYIAKNLYRDPLLHVNRFTIIYYGFKFICFLTKNGVNANNRPSIGCFAKGY